MSGHCFICRKKMSIVREVSEWRGNCQHSDLVCDNCYLLRMKATYICAKCEHYREKANGRGICMKYGRKVDQADHCGQWSENPSGIINVEDQM